MQRYCNKQTAVQILRLFERYECEKKKKIFFSFIFAKLELVTLPSKLPAPHLKRNQKQNEVVFNFVSWR